MPTQDIDFFKITDFVNGIKDLDDNEIFLRTEKQIDEIYKRNPPKMLEKKWESYHEKYNELRGGILNFIFGFIDENDGNHFDELFKNTQKMIALCKKSNGKIENRGKFRKLFLKEMKIFLDLYPWIKETIDRPIMGTILESKMEQYGLEGMVEDSENTNSFVVSANRIIGVYRFQRRSRKSRR